MLLCDIIIIINITRKGNALIFSSKSRLGKDGHNLLWVALECDWADVFELFAEEATSSHPLTVYKTPQLKEIPLHQIIINESKAIFKSIIEKNRVKILHQIITTPTLYAELKTWEEGKAIFDAELKTLLDSIASHDLTEKTRKQRIELLDALQANYCLNKEDATKYKATLCKT